ncbi:MAG TPA: hypothetical protein EYQ31_11835 [Candidatus Handelsmanbacteria bacterium]|nr:hypothetical protein [Candidatus Handelsmanbacteria bacterium]
MPPELPLSADLDRALANWLAHLRHERAAAEKTLEAYARDVRQFLSFLGAHLELVEQMLAHRPRQLHRQPYLGPFRHR